MVNGEGYRYLARYVVRNFIIKKEDEKLELDHSNILSIEYLCDYEFLLFAVLKVTLRIDVRRRAWILKNKRDITVKFELDTVGQDIDVEEWITEPEEVWNEDFVAIFNDEDEGFDDIIEDRLDRNEPDGEDDTDYIEGESYHETQNVLDLYLFHPELLKSSRVIVNRVWTRETLQNMVAEMLTYSKHRNVLMSKFENDEIYREVLSPPKPVWNNLLYLDQYFGFYKKGGMVFYDIDTLYILNLNEKVTAKREDEWIESTFLVPYMEEATPGNGMVYKEDEEVYYMMLTEEDFNQHRFTIGNNVSTGSIAKIIIKDGIEIGIEEAEQAYLDERNEYYTHIKSENKFYNEIIRARMEENEMILYISGNNFDIKAFKPNKRFKIIFDDPIDHKRFGRYEYRMSYAYHYIRLHAMEYMEASHRIILKKVKGPEEEDED